MKTESEKARELFKHQGLTYSDIDSEKIEKLLTFLLKEISESDNGVEMKLCPLRKKDIKFNDKGLEYCYIMVDGFYFDRREAISFNRMDNKGYGFIGFAGWSGTENLKPIISAFQKWVEYLKNNK